MVSAGDVMQLVQSLIWLLAGVGVFIVGMNFMSDALEKSAGVTAIIQSSSATSVMTKKTK